MSDDLIGQLITDAEPGSFVTKWIVIAEAIDTTGERYVWAQGSSDLTRWDTYGLLTEALMQEKSLHIATRLEDE